MPLKKTILFFVLTTSLFAFAEEKPLIKVLDAGQEPRRVINYQPQVGIEQSATMTIEMGMSMTMEGSDFPKQSFDTPVPSITVPMYSEVVDISPSGVLSIKFHYGQVTIAKMTPLTHRSMLNCRKLCKL